MKQALIILAGSIILYSCSGNDAAATAKPAPTAEERAQQMTAASDPANFTTIQWIDSVHQDLGKMQQGGVVEVSWRFKNAGDKPLIITNVNPGCGCTVADKPEEPIAPGGESVIKAKFDSKGQAKGTQRKEVYVKANTGNDMHKLSFAIVVQ